MKHTIKRFLAAAILLAPLGRQHGLGQDHRIRCRIRWCERALVVAVDSRHNHRYSHQSRRDLFMFGYVKFHSRVLFGRL